ncbi:MAG: hypothetical protein KAY11_12900 [Ilumatobacteraceae bacterium]|jgi:hypothetical protein|nr:hypothetical protein [Ilumatobacteraceae bacterium]MBP7890600.1 hypothetical protein [Ilumatobacteraceae bacterium]MBP8210455.1 hypothetical protein [Ilumatobacteraceae bacterium]MBP9051366.1 hypothetical protein [Ilumatobacteraceae bacterium]HRA86000.1 hypothetical protein [Ilumatobacteraceae bacterium]
MSAPIAPADEPTHGAVEGTYTKIVDELILDRIDALRVLRADSQEEKGALLEKIAGRGKPEQDIVSELSKVRPLWRPDRFEEAHRMAMRSLEVLDRNGARSPKLPRLGPLTPPAAYVVEQMTRWIVKGHQNTMVTRVRKLYERREANSVWGSPEHHMLRRARIDAARVEPGYKGNPLGLPTFLLGGAVLSSVASGLNRFVAWAFNDTVGVIIFALVFGVVFFGLAWAALYSAGVARRRIRLCTDQPMKALWETIGACGTPPKDGSYDFAVYAIVLLALAWVLVPMAGWLLFRG